VRRRLAARFGPAVGGWLDELPRVLRALAERWEIEFGSAIPRGSMSVVIRCRLTDGRAAVLKVSPDRTRLACEASALGRWSTPHTPAVLAADEGVGAVLLEAIEPGVALEEAMVYPRIATIAELLTSLHTNGVADRSYPTLARRVDYLFDSGTRLYARRRDLVAVVPRELYERGRRLARRLAQPVAPTALLHGDLTPRNILDGGEERGLVAIDPAPCLGADIAFDAIDLLLWQADDVETIIGRAEQLGSAIDVESTRLLAWCSAFAGMVALELAEAPSTPPTRVKAAVKLAAHAPAA
jgi:streptomycin 6-kinase